MAPSGCFARPTQPGAFVALFPVRYKAKVCETRCCGVSCDLIDWDGGGSLDEEAAVERFWTALALPFGMNANSQRRALTARDALIARRFKYLTDVCARRLDLAADVRAALRAPPPGGGRLINSSSPFLATCR